MDRGLICINGMHLDAYHSAALATDGLVSRLPIAQETISSALAAACFKKIECIFTTWMSGVVSSDSILTCMVVEGRQSLRHPTVKWYMNTILMSALILTDIVLPANVARIEDFHSNLMGIINGQDDPYGDVSIQWYVANRRGIASEFGEEVSIICERLVLWLKLLRQIRLVDLDYPLMISFLKELNDLWSMELPTPVASDADLLIQPLMSNYLITGCIRRPVPIFDGLHIKDHWLTTINGIKSVFYAYSRETAFNALLPMLLKVSNAPEDRLSAVTRSLCFAALTRGNSVYGRLAPGVFAQRCFKFDRPDASCEQLLLDALQIALHSPSRQRRLLPKLISSIIERTLPGSAPFFPWAVSPAPITEQARSHILELARFLASYFVILGFGLDLYESFELPEAFWIISRLRRNSYLAIEHLRQGIYLYDQEELSTYDDNRMKHRWQSLWPLLDTDGSVLQTTLSKVLSSAPPRPLGSLSLPESSSLFSLYFEELLSSSI